MDCSWRTAANILKKHPFIILMIPWKRHGKAASSSLNRHVPFFHLYGMHTVFIYILSLVPFMVLMFFLLFRCIVRRMSFINSAKEQFSIMVFVCIFIMCFFISGLGIGVALLVGFEFQVCWWLLDVFVYGVIWECLWMSQNFGLENPQR